MSGSADERSGRWVYQNLRWYYVPTENEPGVVVRDAPEPALSSLVDTARLADAVGRWTEVSGLPALVYAVDPASRLRLLHPRDSVSATDESASFRCCLDGVDIRGQFSDAAAQVAEAGHLRDDKDSGGDGILAIPICMDWSGSTRVRAVVVSLLPVKPCRDLRCSFRDGALLHDEGLYPRQDADSWAPRRAVLSAQLIGVVEGYAAWLGQILDLRQELAQARALNRSLLVRVEAMEKRLVDSCSDK